MTHLIALAAAAFGAVAYHFGRRFHDHHELTRRALANHLAEHKAYEQQQAEHEAAHRANMVGGGLHDVDTEYDHDG